MTIIPPTSLSDSALLAETARAAGVERNSTASLLSLLGEIDRRKLYLGQGYPSLFSYCTRALHLSEPAAYTRIAAARTARTLFCVSRHSFSGIESATMPAAACTKSFESFTTPVRMAIARSRLPLNPM